MPKSKIEVQHSASLEIVFKDKKKPPNVTLFYFRPIGVKMSHKKDSISALHTISKFSKAELFLLDEVDKKLNTEFNQISITKSKYSAADQRKLTSAIKSWINKKLIIRLQRERYMVSPYFITPPKSHHQEIDTAWRHLNK